MTQEDKKLLLKDLCARIPYGVRIERTYVDYPTVLHEDDIMSWKIGEIKIKPYLRPMSSMTEEECDELSKIDNLWNGSFEAKQNHYYFEIASVEQIDWLNEHHFDFRGLIEKGLAIEAPARLYDKKI